MSGKGGYEKLAEVMRKGGNDVESGIKKMADSFSKFDFEGAGKPYISSGNKIAEAAGAAYNGLTKLAGKAEGMFGGSSVKKPEIEKQTNVQQTTNVAFNPLKVEGEVNFNMKSPDGSITKLTQDQIQQVINSADFQKTIQKMFKDMQSHGTYGNMPSKSGGY
jgi:hypothetical protein